MSREKSTVRTIRRLYRENKCITALTAYDAQMASFIDAAGVDIILVGDSLGMTVLGYETTVPVTLDEMLHHCSAVVRGNKSSLVVGDMPFMTYQVNEEEALRNAARFIKESRVDAVKLEGGVVMANTISRLTSAGIPVMGHIGLLPQAVLAEGGYRKYGKQPEEAERLRQDALAVQKAGAFALVIEGVEEELATEITSMLEIPTIGIAAGNGCSGHIQVINDILGLFTSFIPKHTRRYVDGANIFQTAISEYVRDVSGGNFSPESMD